VQNEQETDKGTCVRGRPKAPPATQNALRKSSEGAGGKIRKLGVATFTR